MTFDLSRRRGTGLLLALLVLLTGGCSGGQLPEQETRVRAPTPDTPPVLEIRFLDVGQGDAALIRSGGRVALIDAGPSDALVSRLRALGVDTVDVLIASHNHADHIGGADAVLDSLAVRFYLDNGHPASTRIQRRVLERVERRGVAYLAATPRTLTLGAARLRIIPSPLSDEAAGGGQNNLSVSVVVEREGFRALFSGDSETELISALLAAERIPPVQLLKAAHHGSRNGLTPAWIARTQPELVVISLGADNGYGHPHTSALRFYCTGGRRVLRTDRSGDVAVRVHADGAYAVKTERPAPDACAAAALR
ncbi:MAG: MBL fold metallo-hydrolase [Gemmatimonadota bacterium]|nr:MBL fold metallo-hydrolase [Gemmatimonadota bacterium]